MSVKYYLIVACVVSIIAICKGQIGLDETCMGCICEGSSNCNLTVSCSGYCGPFRISHAYWTDAGKPVLNNANPDHVGAFETCVQDLQCAAETVRGYMTKFSKDCDGDGRISCNDYIRIHKLGGYGCSGNFEQTDTYRLYHACATALGIS